MRTSRRGLMFKFLIVAGLIFTWLVTGAALDAQAQGIQGLPGSAADATQGRVVHENKLGSVLFFNYYTSDALSAAVNTRITITNVHPTQDIAIHVFLSIAILVTLLTHSFV